MDARPTNAPSVRALSSRSARTLRGAIGAVCATLFAALSHALAGGDITWVGVLTTGVLALPLCVALAGRMGSLWRLSTAVAGAQFLYHWVFAGLGTSSGLTGITETAQPFHAVHLAAAQAFTPAVLAASPAAIMWVGHAFAAALTIALLHHGERAALSLLRMMRRTLPRFTRLARIPLPRRTVLTRVGVSARHPASPFSIAAITHRGPPAVL